jgi:hypothetical protein
MKIHSNLADYDIFTKTAQVLVLYLTYQLLGLYTDAYFPQSTKSHQRYLLNFAVMTVEGLLLSLCI